MCIPDTARERESLTMRKAQKVEKVGRDTCERKTEGTNVRYKFV